MAESLNLDILKKITPEYSPHISHLIERALAKDWGNPEENRKGLIPFGVKPLDLALYGIDTTNGDLIVIQGAEKNRKTTVAVNFVLNALTNKDFEDKPLTVIDTLESSMQPPRYRDTLIANMATRYLVSKGHKPKEACPACGENRCRQLGISPEFLRYHSRTPEQQEAIDYAIETLRDIPMLIYGANPVEGNTRDLAISAKRWEYLIKHAGAKLFVIDHLQQYQFKDDPSDYEKQLRAISVISDIVAQYSVAVFLLSQISMTSQREAQMGTGKYYAAGGRRAAAEASTVFSVDYESGSGKVCITIEASRKASSLSVWVDIDDVSGAFLPYEPRVGKRAIQPATNGKPY